MVTNFLINILKRSSCYTDELYLNSTHANCVDYMRIINKLPKCCSSVGKIVIQDPGNLLTD